MDPEALIWLLFIAIWFISAVVKQIKQVGAQRPGQVPALDGPQETEESVRGEASERERRAVDEDPMIQLLRQLGGEVEVRPRRPPEEHRPPPPPAPAKIKATPRPTRAEVAATKVAKMAAIRELKLPAIGETQPRRRSGAAARAIRRQLLNRHSARRAVLLREVLGKPPGLEGFTDR